jgi:uncharacterized protein YkwD
MKKLSFLILTALILGVGVFAFGVANSAEPVAQTVQTQVERPTVEGLLEYTNMERAKAGVVPLELNPLLNKSAQMKVDELERERQPGKASHTRLSDGRRGYMYIGDAGVACKRGSENLMIGSYGHSSRQTVDAWMNSKEGHREALLSSDFEQVGFAVSENYIAQHFCDTI